MPRHAETRRLPFGAEQMFDLVADVGTYQTFLPWVIDTRIRSSTATEMLADLIVGFGPLRERFTSRVKLQRPRRIEVDYIEGPLRYLHNHWEFTPDGQGACIVGFSVDFAFRSRVFESLAGRVFDEAVRRMVNAFETEARRRYASDSAPAGSASSSSSAHSAA